MTSSEIINVEGGGGGGRERCVGGGAKVHLEEEDVFSFPS